jgi:isopentenyldiphosphate isomerase
MESELLKIFDEHGNQTGVATREEVHRLGYWHETFHCWFISREEEKDYLYFQLRSDLKKDYPNLFDITAAGHILAHESIENGIREVKEEIGIDVTMDELVSLGVLKYCVKKGNMIDKELANVYLYENNKVIEDYNLQLEEVAGIVKAEFDSFREFWIGEKKQVRIQGFTINHAGEKVMIDKMVGKESFVQHEDAYYECVLKLISENIRCLER